MLGYVILLSYTPKHETNIILGDFNASLMERLPHETETLGEHLFREDESRIEQLSLAQQDNRTRFISFCQEHDLTVVNTLFQKDKSKLITYRNVAAPNFHPPLHSRQIWTIRLYFDQQEMEERCYKSREQPANFSHYGS